MSIKSRGITEIGFDKIDVIEVGRWTYHEVPYWLVERTAGNNIGTTASAERHDQKQTPGSLS